MRGIVSAEDSSDWGGYASATGAFITSTTVIADSWCISLSLDTLYNFGANAIGRQGGSNVHMDGNIVSLRLPFSVAYSSRMWIRQAALHTNECDLDEINDYTASSGNNDALVNWKIISATTSYTLVSNSYTVSSIIGQSHHAQYSGGNPLLIPSGEYILEVWYEADADLGVTLDSPHQHNISRSLLNNDNFKLHLDFTK
jgi:hypothetical protein